MPELKSYAVWDASTRWFHWINALCVVALAVGGFLILNTRELGVSTAGKVTLKTIHTWIGYVFAINLLWRIVWAFLGNRYARWRSILPGGRAYFSALRTYVTALVAGRPQQYLGHWVAQWVAAPGVDPGTLLPYASEMYDKTAYESMRGFRKPLVVSHLYSFYVLLVVAVMHVAGVIFVEIRGGGNIISATFTGRKVISGRPADGEPGSGD